mgnify:CR=1 FL=1
MKQTDPYGYHAPTEAQRSAMERWREHCRAGDALIRELAPTSRYQSLAITTMEETCFWGNKAIIQRED